MEKAIKSLSIGLIAFSGIASVSLLATSPASAYTTKENCEAHEGEGKCCILGVGAESSIFYWHVCTGLLLKPSTNVDPASKPDKNRVSAPKTPVGPAKK